MEVFNRNMRYVVWGTGVHAAQFLYGNQNLTYIEFFIDNNASAGQNECLFFGKKVLKFNDIQKDYLEKFFLILATSKKVYMAISRQLHEMGYREFINFAYYQYFDKRVVLLHGNCHMDIIRRFLLSSESFADNYAVYPLPLIQDIEEKCIEENVLRHCDLFIHEDIRAENEFGYKLSDEYVLPRLKKECKEITVPNLFGMGQAFFPQMIWNEHNPPLCGGKDTNGFFPFADTVIDEAVKREENYEEILSFIQGEVFLAEEIQKNFWTYMEKIREREKKWDIPIYDFIIRNFKKKKLFYDPGHPTNVVMKEIALGILEKIGITDDHIFCEEKMDSVEGFVYDFVRETLEIEWEDNEVRKGSWAKKLGTKMTKEEYIREYLFWCYGIHS